MSALRLRRLQTFPFMQECAYYLMESLASDAFMSWLVDPIKNKSKILPLCEAFQKSVVAGKEASDFESLEKPLQDVATRFSTMTLCILALLHPMPGHLGSSVSHVRAVTQYKGQEPPEQALRDIISTNDGDSKTNHWQKMIDEYLTEGQSSILLMPAYNFLMKKLEGIDESNAVDGSVIEAITETLNQRIKFKKDMRPGLLKPLDIQLARVAVLVAGKLTSQDHSGHSKGDVDSLCQALSLFPQAEGVQKAAVSLEKRRRSNENRLRASGVDQWLSKYPTSLEEQPNISLEEFLTMFKEVDAIVLSQSPSRQSGLTRAIGWHLKGFTAMFQASWLDEDERVTHANTHQKKRNK